MSNNMYNHAYELEKAIRNSDEYESLKRIYAAVENDPGAKQVFDSFRNVQMKLQEKQMAGQNISETEVMEAQNIANAVQQNPLVTQLMDAEQKMSMMIQELNKIIIKPLDELYGSVQN